MKNSLKPLFSLFLLFFGFLPLLSMEHPKTGTIKGFFGPKKAQGQKYTIQEKELKIINKIGLNGFIGIDAFSLTHEKTINALKQAQLRGARVSVNLDGTREENRKTALELCKGGISVALYNPNKKIKNGNHPTAFHKKSLIAERRKNGSSHYYVFQGSANFTNLSSYHQEMKCLTKEQDAYLEAHAEHLDCATLCKPVTLGPDNQLLLPTASISPRRPGVTNQRITVAKTPRRNQTFSSRVINIISSIQKRIENVAAGDCVDVVTMTLDDKNFAQALAHNAQKGVTTRLFIDGQSLQKSESLFDKLSEHGVRIFVFNSDQQEVIFKTYPKLLHSKYVVRKSSKPLVIVTSANLTQQSNNDINDCSFMPQDPELVDTFYEENNNLAQACIEYTTLQQSMEHPKVKRVLPFNDKKAAQKHQPVTKKARFEPTPEELLGNLRKNFELLENDVLASYDSGVSPTLFESYTKRLKHLSQLYTPLHDADHEGVIAKKISTLTALLSST